jgi:hypothetical protein
VGLHVLERGQHVSYGGAEEYGHLWFCDIARNIRIHHAKVVLDGPIDVLGNPIALVGS